MIDAGGAPFNSFADPLDGMPEGRHRRAPFARWKKESSRPHKDDGFISDWFSFFFDGWWFGFGDGPPQEWYTQGFPGGPENSAIGGTVSPPQEFASPRFVPSRPHAPIPSRPAPRPMYPDAVPGGPAVEAPMEAPQSDPPIGPLPTPRAIEPPSLRPMFSPDSSSESDSVRIETQPPLTVPPALLEPIPLSSQEAAGEGGWKPRS